MTNRWMNKLPFFIYIYILTEPKLCYLLQNRRCSKQSRFFTYDPSELLGREHSLRTLRGGVCMCMCMCWSAHVCSHMRLFSHKSRSRHNLTHTSPHTPYYWCARLTCTVILSHTVQLYNYAVPHTSVLSHIPLYPLQDIGNDRSFSHDLGSLCYDAFRFV